MKRYETVFELLLFDEIRRFDINQKGIPFWKMDRINFK
jgi:hypothetical protein